VDDLLSEKEQIESMRTWWSEYGNYVISGVAIGVALLFGINHVQTTKLEAQYAASTLYDDLTNAVVDGEVDAAEAIVSQLTTDHPESNYATQSKLAMARLYMDKNRDQDAANVLDDLVNSNVGEEFKQVGRVRLAKVWLYQDKPDDVVALLEDKDQGAFAARNAEILGDAYVALGRNSDAREAYQRALGEAGASATVNQQFVQLKLLDLPKEAFALPTEEQIEDAGIPSEDTLEGETADAEEAG
jgi:predicted negative regulator of RcsB-dependent stress response